MSRTAAVAAAIVVLTVLLSPLQRELYVGDETKYSQVVREMRTGSFFLPTLEGSPFTHKPPLHFWLMDGLTYVFGTYSIWPYVLPSLIAFALLLFFLHRIGGPFAAFVAGTSLMLWGSAQTARMDVEFAALLAVGAWCLYRQRFPAAGFFAGLAFLVKGPMAPVILLALYVFEAIRRKRRPRGSDAWMLVPMLLMPLLWLVPAVMIGGEAFWREIFYKQTVGRAVGAWVHKSPPWFYLVRAPLTFLPWFFIAVPAIIAAYKRNDDRAKFAVSYLLAVLVPYTLLSSKLDVYMIALLPAVGLVIARLVEIEDRWSSIARRANLVLLALFALAGVAGLIVQPSQLKGDDAALIARTDVRMLFVVLLLAALIAIVVSLRGRLAPAVLATGFVAVAALSYAGIALVPVANELASTRPLVRALGTLDVPREQIALFVTPHLWVRGMDPELWRAKHVDEDSLRALPAPPRVIVTRRKDAAKIEASLRGYRKVAELRMIGKWFDVYER
ncbi:MAG TPA: glycosyltransferase family 39 protein [Thermoanaerobaculia bacterium]|nr:glycosyltransferase family 39 protein [Thermoanaerobaculia bacterium]